MTTFERWWRDERVRWVALRMALLPVLFVIVSAVSFYVVVVRPARSPEGFHGELSREELRELGFVQPGVGSYVDWLGGVVRGDFGRMTHSREPISSEVRRSLPITLQVTVLAMTTAVVLGTGGALIARRTRTGRDQRRIFTTALCALASLPLAFTLFILIDLPARWWGYTSPLMAPGLLDQPWTHLRLIGPPAFLLGMTGALATGLAALRMLRRSGTERLTKSLVAASILAALPTVVGGLMVAEVFFSLQGTMQLLWSSLLRRDAYTAHVVITFVSFGLLAVRLFAPTRSTFESAPPTAPFRWRDLLRVEIIVGVAIVMVFALAAVWALVGTPHSPTQLDPDARFQGPSWEHPFGTTRFGQDLFSRGLESSWHASRTIAFVLGLGVLPGAWVGLLVSVSRLDVLRRTLLIVTNMLAGLSIVVVTLALATTLYVSEEPYAAIIIVPLALLGFFATARMAVKCAHGSIGFVPGLRASWPSMVGIACIIAAATVLVEIVMAITPFASPWGTPTFGADIFDGVRGGGRR